MQRSIDGCLYDTEQASVIAAHESRTTHVHRLSTLYQSVGGQFFVVEEQQVHGVDGALLTPLTEMMARRWLEAHGKADLARALFKYGRICLRIEIDSALLRRIDAAAAAAGLSEHEWVLAAIAKELAAGATPPLGTEPRSDEAMA